MLFNHSEHGKLLSSVEQALKKSTTSVALVFFTPYRPWLLEKDLAFFDLAREAGFEVEKVLQQVMDRVMFADDRGVRHFRSTHGQSHKTNLRADARTSSYEGRCMAINCGGLQALHRTDGRGPLLSPRNRDRSRTMSAVALG